MAINDNSHRRERWDDGLVSFGGQDYPVSAGDTSLPGPVGVHGYLLEDTRYVVFWEKGEKQTILQTVLESLYNRAIKNRVIIAELTTGSGTDYSEGNNVQLDVKADGQPSALTATSTLWKGSSALPSYSFIGDPNTGMYSSADDQVHFSAGGTERLQVSSSGIEVWGKVYGQQGNAAGPTYSFIADPDSGMYYESANVFALGTGGAERLRISSSGITVTDNVLFGTAVTAGNVETTAYGMFRYAADGGGGTADTLAFLSGHTFATPGAALVGSAFWTMLSESDGGTGSVLMFEPIVTYDTTDTTKNRAWIGYHNKLFGIQSHYQFAGAGTSSYPSHTFILDTDTGMYNNTANEIGFSQGGNLRMTINGSGTSISASVTSGVDLHINSGTGLITKVSSSRRYKDNIADLDINTESIYDLRPVSFTWKLNGTSDFGFIAEEVHEILPELVVYNDDNTPEAVQYRLLSVLMLEELKKLSEEVKKLKEKN